MAARRKSSRRKRTPPPSDERVRLDMHDVFRRHADMIVLALAALHVMLFLVFFMQLAAVLSPAPQSAFGQAASDAAAAAAGQTPQPPRIAPGILYAAFTAVLWVGFASVGRRAGRRERRFTMLLLAPGTAMSVYLVARMFF